MIQYVEIINFGNSIRIVSKKNDSTEFSDPIEFEISDSTENLIDIISLIKTHLENANLDGID
jgi:hypothetical protein